jgi:hypothetical protein
MTRTLRILTLMAVTAPLACLPLTGCHVTENDHGDKKNVDIGTPFGSMKVHTNNTTDTAAIGLTAYPGAVPVNDGDKDNNSANIDMSFGGFHLGVKAAGFQTPDSPDKVLAFYRKDLASRYGDVIECRDDHAVGTPTHTSQGLTCDAQKHTRINNSDFDRDNLELRAGSELHQHIVGVEPHDGGTKIGLVDLDLPAHLSDHDSKDSE